MATALLPVCLLTLNVLLLGVVKISILGLVFDWTKTCLCAVSVKISRFNNPIILFVCVLVLLPAVKVLACVPKPINAILSTLDTSSSIGDD